MNHPPFHLLIEYLDGNLSPEAQQQVEAHLATCGDCQYELVFANRTLDQGGERGPTAPPANLIRRAVAAFRRKQASLAQRLSTMATLQLDNYAQVAPLGARGMVRERQLLYTFDEYDLDLQIDASNPSTAITLRGQILAHTARPTMLEGIPIHLISQQAGPWLRLTDELGYFGISGLKTDTYSLKVVFEDRDVLIERLVLSG